MEGCQKNGSRSLNHFLLDGAPTFNQSSILNMFDTPISMATKKKHVEGTGKINFLPPVKRKQRSEVVGDELGQEAEGPGLCC